MKIKQMMIMAAAVCMGMVQTACTTQAAATDAPKEKKEICVQLYSVRDLLSQPDSLEPVVKQLAAMGYREVNLNLGCPSGSCTDGRRKSSRR